MFVKLLWLCLVSVAVLIKKVMSFLVVIDVIVVIVSHKLSFTADIVVWVIVVVGGGVVVVGSGLAISTALNGCEVVVALFSFRCSSY